MDMLVTKLEIDEEVIKKTVLCRKNFSCLDGSPPCCSVERYLGDKIFFIKDSNCDCLYKIPFGFSNCLCACPVRREIFRLYNK
jgi:hypothetical protein